MTGVATTPNNVANMIAMRSAGWTVSAIANYTGSSPATINRYLIKHKAKKGALTEQAIEDAKALL
jgi:predicted transcriptional regulator